MSIEPFIASNLQVLEQGVNVLRALDDETYEGSAMQGDGLPATGPHFRHCIDFYECLLYGLENGDLVDYAARSRDHELETDRASAADRLKQLADRLAAIDPGSLGRPLKVRSEQPLPDLPEWCGSTLHRELQFLVSHTVHHYALIVALLGRLGYELPSEYADFGIAPSTLDHWNEAGQPGG